jgi:predicted nucleotidyltransferase
MIKIDEISVNSQVDPSVLTPKSDLYPKIWDPSTKKLNANIRMKLKQIAEDFIRGFKHPLKIKDIILTGSIANYNWNQYSDIDLHVLLDFNEIPDEYMEAFKDYFNAKKEIWNKTHNIIIVGHEVEVYIQDINEPHHSTGVYSVMIDQWLKEPEIKKQDINYDDVISRTEDFVEQINKLSELVSKKDYQKAKVGIDNLKNKIKKYRQAGLEVEGEYSTENMVFKMLRNQGYLEQLSNLKFQAYDSDMGIEEEILRMQEALEEAKKDACYYKAKAKYKVWPSAYASGYLVRCRKKKGKIKEEELEEEIELDEEIIEELSQLEEKDTFSKEKSKGLHGWFSRQGGKGKSKGWVDCNTCRKDKKTGRKTCKTCGRQSGEKRGKYPACRPTPSACTRKGMKSKKSSKQVSWKSKKEE